MVIAAIGTVLAAGYLLWMYQRVAFGEPKPEFADAHIHDVSPIEWIAWTPMLLFIVVLGIYPDIIFSLTNPGVTPHGRAHDASARSLTRVTPSRRPRRAAERS